MCDHTEPQIAPARAETTPASLELIFGSLGEAGRHLEIQPSTLGEFSPEGIWEARRGGQLVGAIMAMVQPGRTGLIRPPRLVDGEPAATADRLLDAAHRHIKAAGVAMAYAALESVGEADDRLLHAHGYEPIARVLYLVSNERDFPAARPGRLLDWEPYSEANHRRLARIVEATYEGTQDCPRLSGVRDIEDVLFGYRHIGQFAPQRWLIVRHAGEDVGCLLVADHPEHGSCELIYMGLAARSRGHGWGKHLARYAQWLTARAGRPRLVVAVDSANDPAVNVYTTVGFHAWDSRSVYVKIGIGD